LADQTPVAGRVWVGVHHAERIGGPGVGRDQRDVRQPLRRRFHRLGGRGV